MALKRVFAGFYTRYDGKPIFVVRVLKDIDTGVTESCRHRMPGRMLQIYLLMRVMRMLVSMIVMLVYCVAVREEARAFLLTFIANYLIYLIYDSWFFFTFEANRKLKKKSNNEKIA